jgi:hypothetical protein
VFGHRQAAAITAGITFGSGAVGSLAQLSADHWARTPMQIGWLIFGVLPMLALAGFHNGAPVIRARPWVLALPVGVMLVSTAVLLGIEAASGTAGLRTLGLGVVGLVLVGVAAWGRDRSDPAGAAPDGDRPRQEPGPATTVER